MSNKSTEEKNIQVRINQTLPTLFVDQLVAARRSDGMSLLRFIANLTDEGWVEQARVMVQRDQLVKMIDLLCHQCNHYPKQPRKRKPKA